MDLGFALRGGFVLAIPLKLQQRLEPVEFKSREVVGVKCALHRTACVALGLIEIFGFVLLVNTV